MYRVAKYIPLFLLSSFLIAETKGKSKTSKVASQRQASQKKEKRKNATKLGAALGATVTSGMIYRSIQPDLKTLKYVSLGFINEKGEKEKAHTRTIQGIAGHKNYIITITDSAVNLAKNSIKRWKWDKKDGAKYSNCTPPGKNRKAQYTSILHIPNGYIEGETGKGKNSKGEPVELELFAVGTKNGPAYLFRANDRKFVATLSKGVVPFVSYCPERNHFATANDTGHIMFWTAEKSQPEKSEDREPKKGMLKWAKKENPSVYLFQQVGKKCEHGSKLSCMAFSSKGVLATAHERKLKLWDDWKEEEVKETKGASKTGKVEKTSLYTKGSYELFRKFEPSRDIISMAFSPSGEELVIGTSNGAIWLYKIDHKQEYAEIRPCYKANRSLPKTMLFLHDDLLAVGREHSLLQLFYINRKEKKISFEPFNLTLPREWTISSLFFQKQNKRLFLGFENGEVAYSTFRVTKTIKAIKDFYSI